MYNYSLLLALAVVVNIPIMLCAKPMIFLMSAKGATTVDHMGHIELASYTPEEGQKKKISPAAEDYLELKEDQEQQVPLSAEEKLMAQGQKQF